MRSPAQEQSGNLEQYKLTIPIDFWEYLSLEGYEGGRVLTLSFGSYKKEKLYYHGTLHAGDEVRLTLDPAILNDPEYALKLMVRMLKPLPTYDLVGVIEWVKFYDQEPFRIMDMRFSSVRQIPRQ